jgi:hypothetical protein
MLKQSSIVLFLFFLCCQVSFAGQRPIGDTIILPQKIAKFIPSGYALIDTAMGDLNFDKYRDITRAGAGLLTCARPLLFVWRNLNKITTGKLKSTINLG